MTLNCTTVELADVILLLEFLVMENKTHSAFFDSLFTAPDVIGSDG